jgi:hypothetical protein
MMHSGGAPDTSARCAGKKGAVLNFLINKEYHRHRGVYCPLFREKVVARGAKKEANNQTAPLPAPLTSSMNVVNTCKLVNYFSNADTQTTWLNNKD